MIEPRSARRPNYLKRSRFFAAAAAYAAFAASLCVLCAQTVFDLTVQPFADTQFFADGVQTAPQVLEQDNTLAILRFTFTDEPQRLEIRHEGFRPVVLTHEELCRKRGFAFLSRDGSYLYCAQFEDAFGRSRCKLIKKELSTFKTVSESGTPGAKRHIVSDFRADRLYVSDMLNSCIEVYSLKDDSLIASIKVFNNPNTVVLSPDRSLLYVSCRGPNHPEKGYLYKGFKMGRLDIIDTRTLKVTESIEAGNQPTGLDVSPDGRTLLLSDFLDNRVRVFRRRGR